MSGSRAENGSSRNQMSGSTARDRGDSDPLLLAAGKLPREIVLPALEAHERNHLSRPLHVVAAPHAPHLKREGDILERGAVGQQGEVLEHHAHLVAPQADELPVTHREEVGALDLHLACAGLDEPRETAHERRLARAGQTHDDQQLAGADLQGDVVDRGDHPLGLEQGRVHHTRAVCPEIRRVEPEDLVQGPTADDGLGHGFASRPAHCHGSPGRLTAIGNEADGGQARHRMPCSGHAARALGGAYCDAYSQGLQTSSFSSIHRVAASSCSISSTSTYIAMVPTWLVVKLMRVRAL